METSGLPEGAVLVVGAGPGLGASVAQRFAQARPVAVAARRRGPLDAIAADIERTGGRCLAVPYDAAEQDQVQAAVARVRERLGPLGTLIYNAGNFVRGRLGDLAPAQFEQAWRVGCFGAFLHAQAVSPEMLERGAGVLMFTGATSSVMAPAHGPAFGSSKFALRGLAMALARDLGPKGIHVAHVLVDGVIDTPASRAYMAGASDEELIAPDAIAESYWHLACQPKRAWSFELDLRPHVDDYFEN